MAHKKPDEREREKEKKESRHCSGETLGRGCAIQARLSALGSSEVFETGIAGVWLVTHHNEDGGLVGRFIEICHIPEILKSQTEDARCALQTLDNLLATAEIGK